MSRMDADECCQYQSILLISPKHYPAHSQASGQHNVPPFATC